MLLHRDGDAFRTSINTYWVQQEREVVQACIVQPRDADELATAIDILKRDMTSEGRCHRKNLIVFCLLSGAAANLLYLAVQAPKEAC